MAWLERKKRSDGQVAWWIRDRRDGRQISMLGGATRGEAEMKLEQYVIRRDIEKEGYDDKFASVLDDLWGKVREHP